ncbi:MAG TPA: FGGY-family carbohydrate kinase [Fluviicoccus sp.]|nr:FGGY-family carbohydrate kinase [Fluviicoccus sp.]
MPRSSDTPESRRCYLAVDLGTSGCKTAVVTLDGRVLGFAFRAVDTQMLDDGGAEQVPADWWRAFCDSAAEVLHRTGIDRRSIAAIACSSQGEGTIPVDADGEPLCNALLWMDMRGGEAVRKLVGGRLPRVAGYDPVKLWRWIRLTGGAPALSGKDPVGHIAWLRETRPDIYARTHKFLNVPDYLNFRLSGRMAAPHDSALTGWATDNRDPDRIDYHPALLRQTGLERARLPEIVRPTDVIGELLPGVAAQLGLPPGVPVVAGSVDNSAAALGSGAVADKALHFYAGTSSWLGAHVPFKKTDVLRHIASVPGALPGRYLMMAMQSAAGSNLSFLRDRLLFIKDGILREDTQPAAYRALDEVAAAVPAGARGLLYLPWLVGERSPVDDPHLRGTLLHLSLAHQRADMVRAFLEGVAYNTRWMLEPVSRFLGETPQRLTIVGGGGQSDVWCRIFADVLGLEVIQPEQPIQANARGAAFIAAMGIGDITAADIPGLVPIRRTFEPHSQTREVYARGYSGFKAAYRALSPFYRRHAWGAAT